MTTSDYQTICSENKRRYGTDIAHYAFDLNDIAILEAPAPIEVLGVEVRPNRCEYGKTSDAY